MARPPKLSKEQKRELKKALGIRNRIDGKFGEGKRKYDLDFVKTRDPKTSESWIASVFFVMNLAHWLGVNFFVFIIQAALRELNSYFPYFNDPVKKQIVLKLA